MKIDNLLSHNPEDIVNMASRASRTAAYYSQTMGPEFLRKTAISKLSVGPTPLLENALGNVLKEKNRQ